MSKKILTVLAPVLAITAFMVIPAMAQATSLQAPAGTTLGAGAVIKGQSTNLKTETATEGKAGPTLTCTHSEFEGTLEAPVESMPHGKLTKDTLTGCTANGTTADINTNASTTAPWQVQVQQPDPTTGRTLMHITGTLQFTVQPQVFGFSATTCDYSASGLQVENQASPNQNVWHVVATAPQFMRQSGSAEFCGQDGTVSGSFSIKSGGNDVIVDMT
jgi:hypothetical protein